MLESDELAFGIKEGIVCYREITMIMNKDGLFVFSTTLQQDKVADSGKFCETSDYIQS